MYVQFQLLMDVFIYFDNPVLHSWKIFSICWKSCRSFCAHAQYACFINSQLLGCLSCQQYLLISEMMATTFKVLATNVMRHECSQRII
jgi:hypothetical protein